MNESDESVLPDPGRTEATPAVLYRRSIDLGEVMPDAAQAVVIDLLDHLFERAMKRQSDSGGFIKDLFGACAASGCRRAVHWTRLDSRIPSADPRSMRRVARTRVRGRMGLRLPSMVAVAIRTW